MEDTKIMDFKKFEQELYKKHPDLGRISEEDILRYEISEQIFLGRVRSGMSQEKLAEECGMLQPSIARIEGGNSFPSFSSLIRIAKTLKKKIRVIFEDAQTVSEHVSTNDITKSVLSSYYQISKKFIETKTT